MWQKLKLEKPNIVIKVILEPSVAIMIETHSEIDIASIEVDNQMAGMLSHEHASMSTSTWTRANLKK